MTISKKYIGVQPEENETGDWGCTFMKPDHTTVCRNPAWRLFLPGQSWFGEAACTLHLNQVLAQMIKPVN